MIDAVRQTLNAGDNLLAEAPTGSGKTAASLHPALAHGLATGRQVVFLTSKTLQQKMAVSALRAMNREGAFRTSQIRAKEKMCANDRVLCHEDFCPYARDYPEKMERSKILERLRESHGITIPTPFLPPPRRSRSARSRRNWSWRGAADAIVADYNYVFDPGVALRHLDREELGNAILLVDEAHNLPDRARQIFSPELLEETFRARRRTAPAATRANYLTRLSESMAGLGALLREAAQASAGGEAHRRRSNRRPRRCATLWKEWEPEFIRYLSWKRETKLAPAEDPIVDLHFAWQRFIAILNLFGPGFACVVETARRRLRLALVCLDPARALAPVFRAAASAILFSATLSPVEVTRRMLGLEKERTRAITLPPPFPRENRKVMILPQVRTTFAARAKNFGAIAQLIAANVRRPGRQRAGACFRAINFWSRWRSGCRPFARGCWCNVRTRRGASAQDIFNALAAPPPGGILLLAVLGGMYAEGCGLSGRTS